MFALGQNWQTTLAVDGKHAGKIGHTLEHSLRQKIGTIDKFSHAKHYKQSCFVENKTEDCKLWVVSGRIFCRRLAEIEVNVRWSVVYSDHTLSSRFPVCARNKPQFLTAGSSQKSFHQTQVREWKAYKHYDWGIVSLTHFHKLVPGETFSVSVASVVLLCNPTVRCHLMLLRREEGGTSREGSGPSGWKTSSELVTSALLPRGTAGSNFGRFLKSNRRQQDETLCSNQSQKELRLLLRETFSTNWYEEKKNMFNIEYFSRRDNNS